MDDRKLPKYGDAISVDPQANPHRSRLVATFETQPGFGDLCDRGCRRDELLELFLAVVGFPHETLPAWKQAINHPQDKVRDLCTSMLQLAEDISFLVFDEGECLFSVEELAEMETASRTLKGVANALARTYVTYDGRRTKGLQGLSRPSICKLAAYVRHNVGKPCYEKIAGVLAPFSDEDNPLSGEAIRKACEQ